MGKMKLKNIIPAALLAVASMSPATAGAADFREHRGVYITPYVSDWPTGPITKYNQDTHKRYMRNSLDRLAANGINVIYFAVRPLCDAAYNSKYEPWSSTVSGTRGVAPPFDPLQFLVEEAHSRGIEVYTWVNVYRYCTSYKHGESPLDYELTHPEWLLSQPHETILNPCLEEVKQRVCDVAADIVDNYDIDGFLFDDYYYTNGMPMELDKSFYDADLAADPENTPDTQLQWRINHVSSLIERVHQVVKGHKPWVVYGIKPAGVASPPNIRDYGLEPIPADFPEQDWQYKGVAADPIYWYSHHYCDFIAPQIYWCNLFDRLQDWWVIASRKFDRHLYSAVSMSKFSNFGAAEFAHEAEYSRAGQADNINGIGFFRYEFYMNQIGKLDGKTIDFPEYMGATAFNTKVLAPIRPWNNVYAPAMVTNLRREGDKLVWDAVEGMRYTIYSFREGEEIKPYNSNLVQVRYTNDYAIPADMADRTFGVAVYDRYGNEYSMVTEGAAVGEPVIAKLIYPTDGQNADVLFDFKWSDTGCDNIVEVATDPNFENIITQMPTAESSMSSYAVNNLTENTTYYWRVRTHAPNAPAGCSATGSFKPSNLTISEPTGNDNPLDATFGWTKGEEGTTFNLQVAADANFRTVLVDTVTTENTFTLDRSSLYYGARFYAKVTATRGLRTMASETVSFRTVDGVPDKPRFVTPAVGGVTIHANECIELERPEGASSMQVQVCANPDFTGGIYRRTLTTGETTTPIASRMRISAKPLVDGQTYYVRACARYFAAGNSSSEQTGEYAVSSFVYSSTEGVSDIVADGADVTISPEGILSMPVVGNNVSVYRADGSLAFIENHAPTSVDLSALPSGLYIIKVSGPSPAIIKFIK